MIIGIIEDRPKLGEILKEGLEASSNQVIVYESVQEATTALLETRFKNVNLPIEALVVDLDVGHGIDDTKMIRTVRQFITPQELPMILISGNTIVTRPVLTQNSEEIRIVSKPITPATLLEALKEEIVSGKE